jgi:hypothetical protein
MSCRQKINKKYNFISIIFQFSLLYSNLKIKIHPFCKVPAHFFLLDSALWFLRGNIRKGKWNLKYKRKIFCFEYTWKANWKLRKLHSVLIVHYFRHIHSYLHNVIHFCNCKIAEKIVVREPTWNPPVFSFCLNFIFVRKKMSQVHVFLRKKTSFASEKINMVMDKFR